MRVQDLMSTNVRTCRMTDMLNTPAQHMWEGDLGAVPVVDEDSRVVGMITDRDISMAAYTQGNRLSDIPVERSMTKAVYTVKTKDDARTAESLMRTNAVRRLPVVEDDGHLAGIVSLNDLARETAAQKVKGKRELTADELTDTVAAIGEPRSLRPPLRKG